MAEERKHSETIPSMQRRSSHHDYHQKGTYMVTIVVGGRQPLLGTLVGQADAPLGSANAPRIELSPLGTLIKQNELKKIPQYYPMAEVWTACIMPDHIHMIIRISEDLPQGCHLGRIIRGFKTGCTRAWWSLGGGLPSRQAPASGAKAAFLGGKAPSTGASAPVPSASPEGAIAPASSIAPVPSASPEDYRPVLFEPGYNDKILLRDGQLDNWKRYLTDNPRRLLIKRTHPQYFTILHDINIAGRSCQMIGNRFLLDIPDKVAVIVHRRYTDAEYEQLSSEWLASGERGGVLVSAAISPREKAILRIAMNRGYNIILLREKGFPPLYKPTGENFNACSAGFLLQISPWLHHTQKATITRQQCLELNDIAEAIAASI